MTNQEIASLDSELTDEDLQALADHMLSEEAALPTESNRALARGVLRLLGEAKTLAGAEAARFSRVETQATIAEWRQSAFGSPSSNVRMAARANEEMAELLRALTVDDRNPKAAAEVADVVIVLMGVAEGLGVDLLSEVDRKMAINRKRTWNLDGTGHGYHVRVDGKDAA